MSERLCKVLVRFLTVLAGLSGPAVAQDFSAGKTAAQLFASDCSACHRSPAGLAKGQSTGALASFLREHYTTKPESASALAAYVAGAGPGSARVSPPTTAPKPKTEANEERPAPRPRPATTAVEPGEAPAAAREAAKPSVDPVVAKLNFYAAARGEPKDTARLAVPAKTLESYANSGTGRRGGRAGRSACEAQAGRQEEERQHRLDRRGGRTACAAASASPVGAGRPADA